MTSAGQTSRLFAERRPLESDAGATRVLQRGNLLSLVHEHSSPRKTTLQ